MEDIREGIVNILRMAMAGNDKLDGRYHLLLYDTANEILSYLKEHNWREVDPGKLPVLGEKELLDAYEKDNLAEAQDSKTLKAVGEWLTNKEPRKISATQTAVMVTLYEINLLLRGEMPE